MIFLGFKFLILPQTFLQNNFHKSMKFLLFHIISLSFIKIAFNFNGKCSEFLYDTRKKNQAYVCVLKCESIIWFHLLVVNTLVSLHLTKRKENFSKYDENCRKCTYIYMNVCFLLMLNANNENGKISLLRNRNSRLFHQYILFEAFFSYFN